MAGLLVDCRERGDHLGDRARAHLDLVGPALRLDEAKQHDVRDDMLDMINAGRLPEYCLDAFEILLTDEELAFGVHVTDALVCRVLRPDRDLLVGKGAGNAVYLLSYDRHQFWISINPPGHGSSQDFGAGRRSVSGSAARPRPRAGMPTRPGPGTPKERPGKHLIQNDRTAISNYFLCHFVHGK